MVRRERATVRESEGLNVSMLVSRVRPPLACLVFLENMELEEGWVDGPSISISEGIDLVYGKVGRSVPRRNPGFHFLYS